MADPLKKSGNFEGTPIKAPPEKVTPSKVGKSEVADPLNRDRNPLKSGPQKVTARNYIHP
jgi:hypothetical protein